MSLGLDRLLLPIKRKIFLLIGKAILEAVDDSGKTQLLKFTCLKNETLDEVEKISDFGLTSHPPPSDTMKTIVLFPNGNRDLGIAIACQDEELRPKDMDEGETIVYGLDSAGGTENRIIIKPDDSIVIQTKDGNEIEMASSKVTINGNLEVSQ